MTRKEVLDKAAECVLHDRSSQYGKVENNFSTIAKFWTVWLRQRGFECRLEPWDVAGMMALMKLARMAANTHYEDGPVDLAGYAACAGECLVQKKENAGD